MPVPADIEQILTKNLIESNTIEIHPNAELNYASNTAKTTLMQDSQGKVQIIYCADSLLNIDALCAVSHRELKTSPRNEITALCKTIQTERLPSVPSALNVETTIIDQRLLNANHVHLDTGVDNSFILIDNDQFKTLITNMSVANIALVENELVSSSIDDTLDIEHITTAVANFTQLRIKQRLEETIEFPPLPDTAQRIIKLRADPNADIKDLTDIVEADPSLAAQVVSWAASPYYAAPGKIKSVHDAIVRVLGFDLVLNLSLGLALGKTLSLPKDSAKGFTPYWQQAVYAATAVEALVGAIPPKNRPSMGMAYLSGLLHNFGYLILAEVFPPHFSNICRYQEANPLSNHCYIEQHLIGITREQLGAWLMRLWNMPEEVCTGLRFQNELEFDGDEHKYANLLYVAMRMLRTHNIGDAPYQPIPDSIFERLHLNRDKATEAINSVLESSAELNAIASNMAA